jgi:hypothetical protein
MNAVKDPRQHFDDLFAASEDPWGYEYRWYEARKRALTLACLPKARYASGYEPGCANGALSTELATRCDRLLISDGAAEAVALAERRVAGCLTCAPFRPGHPRTGRRAASISS